MKLHFECNLNAALTHMDKSQNSLSTNAMTTSVKACLKGSRGGGSGGRERGLQAKQQSQAVFFFIDKTLPAAVARAKANNTRCAASATPRVQQAGRQAEHASKCAGSGRP